MEEQIEYGNGKFEELFQGVYKRLDNIAGLLEKIAQGKEVEIGSSLKSCSTPTQAKVERKVVCYNSMLLIEILGIWRPQHSSHQKVL